MRPDKKFGGHILQEVAFCLAVGAVEGLRSGAMRFKGLAEDGTEEGGMYRPSPGTGGPSRGTAVTWTEPPVIGGGPGPAPGREQDM